MPIIDHINPFFGIHGGGNCLPGPQLPFGLARPGPDTLVPHSTNGLEPGRPIARFSQNHVSGTGGQGRYGNVSLMPVTGAPEQAHAGRALLAEEARVGYYRADLECGVRHELTCSRRAALHRSTFASGSPHGLVLDASAMVNGGAADCRPLFGFVEWTSPRDCQGWAILKGGWGHGFPYQFHFYLRLDRPALLTQ